MAYRFQDRAAAGRALAERLVDLELPDPVVLGVPNGGLVVARPIARALRAPLGVAWVRRIVRPREPDVCLGAVDLDGDVTLNPEAVLAEGTSNEIVTELAYHTHQRLRAQAGKSKAKAPEIRDRTVIIVDDGVVTGMVLIAALRWAMRHGAARRIVAVPVVDVRIWDHVAAHAGAAVTLEARDDGPIARSEIYAKYRAVGMPSGMLPSVHER